MTRQQKVVMSLMRIAGKSGVYNYEFARQNILRYSARIDELRELGVKIRTVRVKVGVFKYILEEYLKEKPARPSWQSERRKEQLKEMEEKGQGSLLGGGDENG